jgi:hypothetical protein
MTNLPRNQDIENLLRRQAQRLDVSPRPHNFDQEPARRPISPDHVLRPVAEPAPTLSPSPREADLSPSRFQFKSPKQVADQAAAEEFLDDLAKLVDRKAPTKTSASRLTKSIKRKS